MASKILISLGIFLTIYVNYISAHPFTSFDDKNQSCVPASGICHKSGSEGYMPCCNKFDLCFASVSEPVARCGGDGLLGSSCDNTFQCTKVQGAICENGICTCGKDATEYTRHRCKPNHMSPRVTWNNK
ncbi:uncharacterized protein LOC103573486 [Microplitis demolitor]|uniref:uncharacterized protein LOC103573486 n=1 Tax=Microplitis demolitor TaxID=69319 RepID=UPI0004CD7FF7|nr:uncharacterized protein LOC103573486 [Microplitis demolitor]